MHADLPPLTVPHAVLHRARPHPGPHNVYVQPVQADMVRVRCIQALSNTVYVQPVLAAVLNLCYGL